MSDTSHHLRPLSWYKGLATAKGRSEAGAFLVESARAIDQITSNYPGEVIEIITIKEPLPSHAQFNTRIITEKQMHSVSNMKTSQGLTAVIRMPENTNSDTLPKDIGTKVLFLENIQDPGNAGTLIRTAAAFGFEGVILSAKCADPFSAKCVHSTAGTILSVWTRRTSNHLNMLKSLKQNGKTIVLADINGTAKPEIFSSEENLVLALGSEAFGPSKELLDLADYRLKIPINSAKAESLNVAASGAICMYLSSIEG